MIQKPLITRRPRSMTSMIEKEGAIWELTSCPYVLCTLWHLKHDPETPLEILKLCMDPLLMLQASCVYIILIDFICAWAAWANYSYLPEYEHTLSQKNHHIFSHWRCFVIKTHIVPAAPHRRWKAPATPPTCAKRIPRSITSPVAGSWNGPQPLQPLKMG